MNHGKEISQKIRSAIKAKLIELNAYVDDELPDYIMVMVANKKPKSQMNDDLGLFLNTNTEKFTIWLYNLLEKLQSLGSDQQKSNEIESSQSKGSHEEESNVKQSVPSVPPKEKEKQKTAKDKPAKAKSLTTKVKASSTKAKSETKTKTKSESKAESVKGDKVKTVVKEKVEKVAKTEKSVAVKPTKALKRPAAALQDEDVLTDLLGDRAETDEFSAEFKEEPEVKKVKKTVVTEKIKPTITSSTTSRQAVSTSELRNRTAKSLLEKPKPGSVHSRLGVARSSLGEERGRRNVPRAVTSPIKRARSPGRRIQSADSYSSREVHPVRRKQPMSYVGKVRSREFEEEDDDEEDNPRAGGMSSVIAFSSRRPSVPLAQQANKNLILRATREAERSVSSTMKSVLSEKKLYSEKMYSEKEKAYVRPIQQSPDKKVTVTLHGKRSGRVIGRVAAQLHPDSQHGLVSRSRREEQGQADYEGRRVGLESKSKREELIKEMTYTIENRQPEKPKPLEQTKTTGQEVARVRPVVDNRYILKVKQEEEESEGGSRDGSVVEEEETEAVVYDEQTSPVESEEPEAVQSSDDEIDPEVHQILQAEDAAVLEEEVEEEATPSPEPASKEEEEEDKMSDNSQETEITIAKEDEVHDDDDEEEQRRKLLRQQKMMRQKARAEKRRAQLELKKNPKKQKPTAEVPPSDTRFIVTLDGVDPDSFAEEVDTEVMDTTGEEVQYDEEEVEEFQTEEEAAQPMEQPIEDPLLKLRPPEIKPISISLRDTDDEVDEEEDGDPLPSTIAKSTEKCRFWPACINGNACPYVHPTQPCKMFPHCKFADKCLYIHPNCKFDSKCTRKDCPFTHASKRSNLTTVIQKIVQVPVAGPIGVVGGGSYPQQSKSSGICRFFPNCTNMNCTFIHPMPCKFGISCMNKSKCKFYHAPLPTKDKLTWIATGKQDVK